MGTVIKTDEQNPRLIKRLETVTVGDHLGEAKLVLERSREQAEAFLEQKRREAVAIEKQAGERGYEAGFKRGYQAGTKAGYEAAFAEAKDRFEREQAALVDALSSAAREYDERKHDLYLAARQDVIDFAAMAADRVVRRIGNVDRAAVEAVVERALAIVSNKSDVQIRIHPKDRDTVERFAGRLAGELDASAHVRLIEDGDVAPGGCVVSTAGAEVDATIDGQLEAIAKLMVGDGIDVRTSEKE